MNYDLYVMNAKTVAAVKDALEFVRNAIAESETIANGCRAEIHASTAQDMADRCNKALKLLGESLGSRETEYPKPVKKLL